MRFSDIDVERLSLANESRRKAILVRYLAGSKGVRECIERIGLRCEENFKIRIISEKQQIVCKTASLDGGRFCGYF